MCGDRDSTPDREETTYLTFLKYPLSTGPSVLTLLGKRVSVISELSLVSRSLRWNPEISRVKSLQRNRCVCPRQFFLEVWCSTAQIHCSLPSAFSVCNALLRPPRMRDDRNSLSGRSLFMLTCSDTTPLHDLLHKNSAYGIFSSHIGDCSTRQLCYQLKWATLSFRTTTNVETFCLDFNFCLLSIYLAVG